MTNFNRRNKMLIKIITIVTLIMATVIGVLSFSELSEHSGILYIGTWTFSVLAISETFRRLLKGI